MTCVTLDTEALLTDTKLSITFLEAPAPTDPWRRLLRDLVLDEMNELVETRFQEAADTVQQVALEMSNPRPATVLAAGARRVLADLRAR